MDKLFKKDYKKRNRITPIAVKNKNYSQSTKDHSNPSQNNAFGFSWGGYENKKTHHTPEKKKKPQYVKRNENYLKQINKKLQNPFYSPSQCENLQIIKEKLIDQLNTKAYDQRKLEKWIVKTLALIENPTLPNKF